MSCQECREVMVHALLGEVDAATAAAFAGHRERCAACAREATDVGSLLIGVRRLSGVEPSPGFAPSLARRLVRERLDEQEDALRHARVGDRFAARAAFVGHRLKTSAGLRVLFAAAAVNLLALGVWFLVPSEDGGLDGGRSISANGGAEGAPNAVDQRTSPGPSDPLGPRDPNSPRDHEVADGAPTDVDVPRDAHDLVASDLPRPDDVIEPPTEPLPSVDAADPLDPWPAAAVDEGKALVELDNRRVEYRFRLRDRFQLRDAERENGPVDVAVRRGMRWMVTQQDEDGSWDPGYHDGQSEARVGVTALCLLALLQNAERGVPGGIYKPAVDRAFDYLRSHRQENGTIGAVLGDADVVLFNHALATLAFTERWVLTGGDQDEALLADALERLDDLGSQRRFRERQQADDITAPWVAMALETARAAGVPTAVNLDRAAEGARDFVAKLVDIDHTTGQLRLPGPQLCALAATAALDPLVDDELDYEAYRPSVELLLGHLETPTLREPTKIHFASLDLHHRGGTAWQRWEEQATRVLLGSQDEDGGWAAEFEWDAVQAMGGDLYETALTVMTLSVEHRQSR